MRWGLLSILRAPVINDLMAIYYMCHPIRSSIWLFTHLGMAVEVELQIINRLQCQRMVNANAG